MGTVGYVEVAGNVDAAVEIVEAADVAVEIVGAVDIAVEIEGRTANTWLSLVGKLSLTTLRKCDTRG
ncbi:hypothetical protein SK128_007588 [Halocaridina rubra]|uniref:Uncharacterized protein n=1 Tax=Halocaridina rubra TaxID=373956 RepID=A0AAN9ABU6_HALRR